MIDALQNIDFLLYIQHGIYNKGNTDMILKHMKFIYLFIHLFIYSFIYSFIYLFIYLLIYLFIYLDILLNGK